MSNQGRFLRKSLAYFVHAYTASGLVWGLMTALAIVREDYPTACLWMLVAFAVDSTDGFLARRVRVKEVLPGFDGRRLDDIVDYLNYTFLPLVLIARAGWLPGPVVLWVGLPLVASAFAFANTGAKEEDNGFFVGFPSYWNIFVFYVVLWLHQHPVVVIVCLMLFSIMSVLPIRFVYPSHACRWKFFFNAGCILWVGLVVLALALAPDHPVWLLWVSLIYPGLYVVLSIYLDVTTR